jgi:hypothetical protein
MRGSKDREAMRRDQEEKGIFRPLGFFESYLRVKAAREAKREEREIANMMVVSVMLLLVE